MERVKGIEPSSVAWEATALPLSYTRINVQFTRANCSCTVEVASNVNSIDDSDIQKNNLMLAIVNYIFAKIINRKLFVN